MRQLFASLAVVLLLVAGAAPAAAAVGGVSADSTAIGGPSAVQETVEPCEFPVTLTDATGTEVTIENRPERVTTTNPSAAQTMWEIGGKSQVVGLSKYASYLEGADSRTNVSSSGFGVSIETVVGTNPDLVLAPNATPVSTVKTLRQAGLKVYYFREATTIEDVREKTTRMGKLTGNCVGAAEANEWMMANVETARSATQGLDDKRALYPLGGGYVAADDTFITAMIEASGGVNVAAAEYEGYPKLNDEVILELNPDYLVLTGYTTYLTGQQPYNSTAAVQQNNTVMVNVNYMNQPAPRSVVMAVRQLTKGFHPEAYAGAEWTARSEVSVSTPTATPTPTAESTPTPTEATTETPTETSTSSPGFGVATALVALLAAAFLARRE